MTQEQSWILTDLDAHTIDFDPFKYDYTNFTMFRSVDYSRPFVKHSLHRYIDRRAFTWLKVPTSAFTFKTLSRHYAERVMTHSE